MNIYIDLVYAMIDLSWTCSECRVDVNIPDMDSGFVALPDGGSQLLFKSVLAGFDLGNFFTTSMLFALELRLIMSTPD